jgi:hypothetical protein
MAQAQKQITTTTGDLGEANRIRIQSECNAFTLTSLLSFRARPVSGRCLLSRCRVYRDSTLQVSVEIL